MAGGGIFMDILHRVAAEAIRIKPFIPTYTHLLASTVFLLYTGAHASLTRPSSAAEPEKKSAKSKRARSEDDDEEDEEVVVQKMEGLSPSDAVIFPIMAGATLATLYFLIKWLKNPDLLNKVLNYYFSIGGTLFAVKFVKDVFSTARSLIFPSQYSRNGIHWRVNKGKRHFEATSTQDHTEKPTIRRSPFPGIISNVSLPSKYTDFYWSMREGLYTKANLNLYLHRVVSLRTPVDLLDAAAIVMSVPLVAYFALVSKPWYLTNFLGFSFSYGTLQYMSPTTFNTGSLLLSALFFYDIYFVFFTPMMETVATKLNVPIKLLFPRPSAPDADPKVQALAMLGLGDIVIPGIMIGLALRFDLYLHYLKKQTTKNEPKEGEDAIDKSRYLRATGNWGERFWTLSSHQTEFLQAKDFQKPYFKAGLTGYVAGMIVTLVAMQVSRRAQPALLYLVPGVLISLWGTALARGDIKEMYKFSEDSKEEEKKEGDKSDNNEDKKSEDSKVVHRSETKVEKTKPDEPNNSGAQGEEKAKSHTPSSSGSSWDGLDSEPSSTSLSRSTSNIDEQTEDNAQAQDQNANQDADAVDARASHPSTSSSTTSTDSTATSTTTSASSANAKSEPKSKSKSKSSTSKPKSLIHFSITLPPQTPATAKDEAKTADRASRSEGEDKGAQRGET
ncbi:MAG: hypothetical protein Q9160_001133 [Pyrenula sp. 1 TL-2023]